MFKLNVRKKSSDTAHYHVLMYVEQYGWSAKWDSDTFIETNYVGNKKIF